MRPPWAARLIVSALVRDPHREFVLGDLDEAFSADVQRRGRFTAYRRYWSQALRSAWHARLVRPVGRSVPRKAFTMWNLAGDFKLGLRTIVRSPSYSGVAILTIALAIGANTLLFSIANPLVARPLPVKNPSGLGWIWETNVKQGFDRGRVSLPDFLEWRQSAKSYTDLAAYTTRGGTLLGHGDAEAVKLLCATTNLQDVWGMVPRLGRLFQPGEDTPGQPMVGVLSHRYWRDRFDGDSAVLNRTFLLDGRALTIVGVMEPEIEIGNLTEVDIWTPLPLERSVPRDERTLRVVGRLAEGATLASTGAEITGLAAGQAREFPKTNEGWIPQVVSTKMALAGGDTWVILGLLSVVVVFVLLIACANLANLALARVVTRHQELAVRLALGARRMQLIRPLLVESLILGLVGGIVGLGMAQAGLRLITSVAHDQFMRSLTIDRYVLAFTGTLSVVTPVLFSVWPALIAGRAATAETLRESRASGGRKAGRRRNVLVASQVALALSLLVLSSLVVQSMLNMQNIDLGLDVRHGLRFTVELPHDRFGTDEARARFAREAADRLAASPGIMAAGVSSHLPLFDAEVSRTLSGTKHDGARENDKPWVSWFTASPGFFSAAGITVVAGRLIQPTDRANTQLVTVLGRAAAEKYFDTVDEALGRSVVLSGRGQPDRSVTIVGVVTDTRNAMLTATNPQLYLPFDQWPSAAMTFLVTSPDPEGRASDAREVMRQMDRAVAVSIPKTLHALVEEDISSTRIINWLFTGFALLALALAASGLYGVVSYSVGQRRREIGVRMALGAAPGAIGGMIFREGLRVTLIGAAGGVTFGLLLARASASILFGVNANDPATFAVVTGTVLLVALAAIWSPAVRAMRVDPVRSLRAD
jgi:putative ABC transport system permease protein